METVKSELMTSQRNLNMPQGSNIPIYVMEKGMDEVPEITLMVNESFPPPSAPPPAYGELLVAAERIQLSDGGKQNINVVVHNSQGPRNFLGTSGEDVEDFFREFESHFKTSKLQDEQKLDKLASFLSGGAKKCYWSSKELDKTITYDKMKVALTKAFKPQRPGIYARAAAENRKQQPGEPVIQYVWDKLSLLQKCDPKPGEPEIVQGILRGLRDPNVVSAMYSEQNLDTFDTFYAKLLLVTEGFNYAKAMAEPTVFNIGEATDTDKQRLLPKMVGSGPPREERRDTRDDRRDSRGRLRGRGRGRVRFQVDNRPRQDYNRRPRQTEGKTYDVECWTCHDYGHFARNCPLSVDTKNEPAGPGIAQVRRN